MKVMRRPTTAGLALALILLTSGCAADDATPAPSGHTVSGTLETHVGVSTRNNVRAGSIEAADGEKCSGDGFRATDQVIVEAADGAVLGFASLGDGVLDMKGQSDVTSLLVRCVFSFEIDDVDAGVGPYAVGVAGKGSVLVDEEDLDDVQIGPR
ncbi:MULTISPECIES: hypothetical protein [unclassified Microbacterium]|uniref:hypothetical protein n=1 Tax=unclassified Microbacterium TaxID=2609290 RepID=UPI003018E8B3